MIWEAIALHLIRSIQTAALHQASWLRFREAARQHSLQRPGDLQLQHVARHGYWTSHPARLEQVLDEYMAERDVPVTSSALFRVSLEDASSGSAPASVPSTSRFSVQGIRSS